MVLPWRGVLAVAAMAVGRAAWAGDAPCPTPAAIATELERLPESGALARLGGWEVTAEGQTLRIVLRDGAGQVLGVRALEAPRDCRQRAAIAAVVLAAWSHTWDGPVVTLTPVAAPEATSRRRGELGVQGGVHHDGSNMAPGATVLAGLQLFGPLSAGVTAGFVAARQHPLGPGAVEYALVRAGAGLVYHAHLGAAWFDAGLFPLIVRLGVTPRELPGARAVTLWAGALEARFRLGVTWRRIMPFVSGSLGRRFVRDRVTLEDVPQPAEIAPWDLSLGIGVAAALGGDEK